MQSESEKEKEKVTMTASERKDERKRARETNGRGEVNSLHKKKSEISQCESTVSFPFENGFAVNWHERSTMAATITRTKNCSTRLTFKTNEAVSTIMWWHKWIEKRLNYAHKILLLAHIFQIISLQKWSMQMLLKVFQMIFSSHSLISRWNDSKAFPVKFLLPLSYVSTLVIIRQLCTQTYTIE